MLRGRSFAKKTRTGNVVNVVREHYLRDDIPCSIRGCTVCQAPDPVLSNKPHANNVISTPHLLIPDTNVLLHQIDIIEHPYFTDVIVLQTVLDEIKHRSPAVHERVLSLLSNDSRRFYLFSNENHRATFVERMDEETPNDHNDRAIRMATKWYDEHVGASLGTDSPISVALITDDSDNKRKAAEEGLTALSVRDYVEGIAEYPELHDMIASNTQESTQGSSDVVYPEHLSPLQVNGGLKSGSLLQGTFSVSSYNVMEASIFALVDGIEQQIKITGKLHQNRAIHGDQVAVELLPRSQWNGAETSELAIEPQDVDPADSATENENVRVFDAAENSPATITSALQPSGRVVAVIRRNWKLFCGIIGESSAARASEGTSRGVFFLPVDRRIPRIRIRTRQAQSLIGKRIAVAIDGWLRTSKHPSGHFVRIIGDIGDRETETEVILLEHDVPYAPFSNDVLRCLPEDGERYTISASEVALREDLRALHVCSIDPPGCTDIDDALHCRVLPNGMYEVGVHIADVTHFVKPGTAMDEEAAKRGTTVYLVDKRIDMLPSLLGTNLCSLRSNVDRLAFSCIWTIDSDANIQSTRFCKSVIYSKASLTYEEAQARIDDLTRDDDLTVGIRKLNDLAKRLRRTRIERGALTLASPEVRFQLENDSQDPLDVELKELKETNALVEEFMLLANISVARQIFHNFADSSLLRRHPSPAQTSFDGLKRAVAPFGININTETSKELADSLDEAVIDDDQYFNKLLRIMTTRCMMQAVYFCSGMVPEKDFWHYGLAVEIYTHFTSPIRRYSDVIVHRLLAASINPTLYPPRTLSDKNKLNELTSNLNFRHRMAQQASRSSVELYTQLYFRNKILEEDGRVIRVLKNGLVVLIPRYGIEGVVDLRNLNLSEITSLVFDAENETLQFGDIMLRSFSKVKVRISIQETSQQGSRSKVVLQLLEPSLEGSTADRVQAGTKRKEADSEMSDMK